MHDDKFEAELAILWRREMVAGTYMPKWINADIGGATVRAIAFVVNRSKPGYAGRLDDEQIVSIALRAHGAYGSCADYLINTATSLEVAGIADPRLSRLAKLCRSRQSRREVIADDSGQVAVVGFDPVLVNVYRSPILRPVASGSSIRCQRLSSKRTTTIVIAFHHRFAHRTAAHHIHVRLAVGLVAQA